jgi:hypothetical protein
MKDCHLSNTTKLKTKKTAVQRKSKMEEIKGE